MIVAAGVADEFLHLIPLVFAGRYPYHFLSLQPHAGFARAGWAVAVRIHRLGEPHALLKAEGPVGQCPYRAHIDHVARKIVVNNVLNVSRDLGGIATGNNAVHTVVGDLVGGFHTAVAKNAAVHVQLDLIANIDHLILAALELEAGAYRAVLIAQVLQLAFSGLVAHRAIERVVDEQEFHHAFARFQHLGIGYVLHHHAVHDLRAAAGHRLWHRVGVGRAALRYFNDAGAAIATAGLQFAVIAHGRRSHLGAYHAGRLENRGALWHIDFHSVYCYFHFCSVIIYSFLF